MRNSTGEPLSTLLREILTSRVYEVARETPLDPAPRLSRRLDNDVLLKREDLQPIFSFKIRGAYNRIARLLPASARAASSPPAPAITRRAWRFPRAASASAPSSSCRGRRRRSRSTRSRRSARRSCWSAIATPRRSSTASGSPRDRPRVHPSLRRSAGDRRAGDGRRRDAAAESDDSTPCSCRSAAAG